jgi:hypothetical protein
MHVFFPLSSPDCRRVGFWLRVSSAVRVRSSRRYVVSKAGQAGNGPRVNDAAPLDAIVTLPGDAPTSGDAELTAQGTGSGGEVRQLAATIGMSTSFGSDADFDEIPDPCDKCPALATFDTTDSAADSR